MAEPAEARVAAGPPTEAVRGAAVVGQSVQCRGANGESGTFGRPGTRYGAGLLSVPSTTVRAMTSTPHSNSVRWLLEVTAAAAPAGPAAFEEQRQLLRSVAQFDRTSQTWWARIGTLDVRALEVLQRLYEAAERFGTAVRVDAIAAPEAWSGPCFTDVGELASVVTAQADQGRLLGQLPYTK